MDYPFREPAKAEAAINAVKACCPYDQIGVNAVLFGGTVNDVKEQGWRTYLWSAFSAVVGGALAVAATHFPFLAPLISQF